MAKGSYLNRQNRTTRLLGLLREDRAWTMQLLSESLGVSIRTLMRDCDELRNQGYPIETERGRGGGVRLSSRWGLEKLMLNNEEIINLLVSLAISESLNSPILAHHVKSLRQKLANIFPEKQRKSINQLRKRILMGNVASTEVAETYTAPKPAITDVVTDCFFHSQIIRLQYGDGAGNKTHREVEAQYFLYNWPVWYLLGWDHLRQAPRIFRIDRVLKASNTGTFFRLRPKSELTDEFERFYRQL